MDTNKVEDQKIYLVGRLGITETARLLTENKEFLENRFPEYFISQVERLCREVTEKGIDGNIAVQQKNTVFELTDGGLFGALWRLGEANGCGLEINIRNIPVQQEFIEILELFDSEPYETPSLGCYIIAADKEPGLPGAVEIGRLTRNKARIITGLQSVRYLTPPSRQAKDLQDRDRGKQE